MTDPTLAALITEAHKKIDEAWKEARKQHPTQPPHPITTLCAVVSATGRCCLMPELIQALANLELVGALLWAMWVEYRRLLREVVGRQ